MEIQKCSILHAVNLGSRAGRRYGAFAASEAHFKPTSKVATLILKHCAPALRSSGNHKALLSAKLNQARLDGEAHDSFGPALAPGVVRRRDELTER